jgi:hypothetical protein
MSRWTLSRRALLRGLAATAVGAGATSWLASRSALAQSASVASAKRVIFFYFPDGVAGPSQDGQPSQWHATGSEHDFTLPAQVEPLVPHKDDCLFFRGFSMGPTDDGSHPGGAKKLLTAKDGGQGWSIDHFLAQTVGADRPFRHVYLGAMANQNNASGDKHITYVAPGQTVAPEDDPRAAFTRLFGQPAPDPSSTNPAPTLAASSAVELSVVDGMLDEMSAFRARMGVAETAKLDFHLESLRALETRVRALHVDNEAPGTAPPAVCSPPDVSAAPTTDALYDPARFPDVLRAQIDVMVHAMACDLTRVGTLQCSHHTSELIMSRFAGTEMHTPGYDMRSHQASHYGASHDDSKPEFDHFKKQRRYWTSQLAYLLDSLKARPEGDGTMLDHSLVLLCTEVCDGNTHLHHDMPFILAGGGAGAANTGRLVDVGGRRHGDLLAAIARAMGSDIWTYGDGGQGAITL